MIKNHPFQNGNKRIAITTLLTFLYKNNKWIEVDNMKFYNFARWVASSDPEVKDQTVGAIAEFIKKNSRKL
jgi:prophage maintenance system killer protein